MVQTNHNDSSYFKTNLIGTQMHTINTPLFPSAAIPDLIANTLEVNALRGFVVSVREHESYTSNNDPLSGTTSRAI